MINPHRETVFEFDRVIVGQSVCALAYALKYSFPIFGVAAHKPLRFRYVPEMVDLSEFGIENEVNVFRDFNREVVYGMEEIKLWNILAAQLSLSGLSPAFGDYTSCKFEKERLEIVANERRLQIRANEFIIFDSLKNSPPMFEVNDYINIHSADRFEITRYLNSDCGSPDELVYETLMFESDRKSCGGCDCVAKSTLSDGVMTDFKYSATAVRMRVERDIFWNLTKDIKVSLSKREIVPVYASVVGDLEYIMNFDIADNLWDNLNGFR